MVAETPGGDDGTHSSVFAWGSRGQRSVAGCNPRCRKKSQTWLNNWTTTAEHLSHFRCVQLSEVKPMDNTAVASGDFHVTSVCGLMFSLLLHLSDDTVLVLTVWHSVLGQSLSGSLVFFSNSSIEPRLLWERVEKLAPRPGSGSSSGSSNSGSQPGSHPGSQSGSGERFRVRCRLPFLSSPSPCSHTGWPLNTQGLGTPPSPPPPSSWKSSCIVSPPSLVPLPLVTPHGSSHLGVLQYWITDLLKKLHVWVDLENSTPCRFRVDCVLEILFSHGKDLEVFTAAYYHTMFWCRFARDTNSHHNFNSKS